LREVVVSDDVDDGQQGSSGEPIEQGRILLDYDAMPVESHAPQRAQEPSEAQAPSWHACAISFVCRAESVGQVFFLRRDDRHMHERTDNQAGSAEGDRVRGETYSERKEEVREIHRVPAMRVQSLVL